MAAFLSLDELFDNDVVMENYIKEYDKTVMPVPDMEFEPFILLNKVRKYYMEYIIKLLSINYECNLKVPSRSLYRFPSAIWRCAKSIEMSAAQMSMVLQIYRRNILNVVEELKTDTKAGKLNKKLYDCLYKPPQNEKRTQTTLTNTRNCNCQCTCNQRKRVKKTNDSPNTELGSLPTLQKNAVEKIHLPHEQFGLSMDQEIGPDLNQKNNVPVKICEAVSETQSSDDLVQQLQKLFESDGNDDDIFESVLCDEYQEDSNMTYINGPVSVTEKPDPILEAHSAQIKSLDERLASLSGLLINNEKPALEKPETPIQNSKKIITSKWLCEEYFLKMKLLELLDQIRDNNRERLKGIRQIFADLFGEDSEDEELMSPLNETPEFVLSCKERIAPWVVKMLTPYYIKGRIKGKALFKALAKHLIRLIYQCSQYPEEYEVHSFVSDFLKSHKVIRCEADFKEFKIMNI